MNSNYNYNKQANNTSFEPDIYQKEGPTKYSKKRIKSSGKINVPQGATHSVSNVRNTASRKDDYILNQQQNEQNQNMNLSYGSENVSMHQRIQSNPVYLTEFTHMMSNNSNNTKTL